jgi:hypothetical protein
MPIWARSLRSDPACAAVEITDDKRDLLLSALFELPITHAENDRKPARIKALVVKLGRDPDAVLFGGS